MRFTHHLRTRVVAALTTGALVAGGLSVSAFAFAPQAAAEVSPIAPLASTTVSSDSLPTVQVDGVVWDQAIAGNVVWAAGAFNNARPAGAAAGTNLTTRNNLLAYNLTTGGLITAINPNLNREAKAVALSPDGKRLYVGGLFTSVNGVTRYRLAAFDSATGALISSFAPSINSTVSSIVATDTTVYIAGNFTSVGGQTRNRVAAVSASTGKVTTWAPTADSYVQAMVMSPDGKLILGGAFQNINGSPAYGLAAVNATDGTLLPWNATQKIRNAGTQSAILSLTTDGKAIYGTGYHFGAGGNLEGTFSADPVTGDVSWVEDCHGDTYDAYSDGTTVYTVSHAHYCGNLGGFFQSDPWATNMKHALAFTANATGTLQHDPLGYFDWYGTPSPSMVNWFPDVPAGDITGKGQGGWTITGNGQYVVMGGEFPSINGQTQQGLARFAVRSIAPNAQGPQYSGTNFPVTAAALQSGVRVSWQANSDQDDLTLNYQVTRNGTPIYTTSAQATFWNRPTMGFIDTTAAPGTTYTYRVSATDGSGNVARSNNFSFTTPAAGTGTAYGQRVIADGAAPYWPMNEASGTTLLDNNGFNDGDTTTTGITRSVTPGAIAGDTATSFDGSNASASTRTAITGPNTFTVQAWIKTTTTNGGKIIGFGNNRTGTSGSYDRHVYMDGQGRIWFGVYPNFVATVNSGTGYNDGQWHQITASMGADGMKLSIDGKPVASRADITSGQAYSGYWRVGGDNTGGWPGAVSNNFAGAIDEVAIYPTVLTRAQIDAQWVASGRTSTIPAAPADPYGAAVFNDNPTLFWRLGDTSGTTATDSGPIGDQTGIYQNGVVLGSAGAINGFAGTSATFDGSDDLVASTTRFSNPRIYSEEAWFKTTDTDGGKIIGFGDQQNGTSGNYDRHVYMDPQGKVTFGVWTGFANTITTQNSLNDGQWHHVVATQNTTEGMKLYVDGALVGTNGQTDAQGYDGYWRVGGDNQWNGWPFLSGSIDDVAVYPTVLTAAQVANHWSLGTTGALPNQAPTADFTSASNLLNATFTSTAADTDGTVASYAWNFGDTTTSTDANPSHTYGAAGTYQVTLTVTDNKGATTSVTHPVTVTAPAPNQAPNAGFTSTSSVLTAAFTSTSSDADGTVASYAWNFGDNATSTDANPSHTYGAAGTYQVTLTVTDDKGATASVTHPVTVTAPANQAPVASFTVTAAQLTANVDATASSDPDGTIASYAWNFGDGFTTTGVTASHAYATEGSKTVTLTVTDNKGATTTTSQQVQVTAPPVNQAPVASFTSSVQDLTANVESTSTDPDGSIVSQSWNFGDNTPAVTTAAATHSYATAGTYTITLSVTDNGGLTRTASKTVTVTAPPPANVAPTARFASTTSNLQVSVNGSTSTDPDGTIAAYAWNFGDNSTDLVSTPTANHTYAAAGTYQVTLTVTDNSGATNSVTQPVTVTTPAPTPLIADSFSRTSTSSWGTADIGGAWTVTGGATNFSVNAGTGKVRLGSAGAGPSATLGTVSAADVSTSVAFSADKAPTGAGLYLSVGARKVGNSEYRTTARLLATGVVQLQLSKTVNGTTTNLRSITVSGLTYSAGDVLNLKFEVTGSDSVALAAKIWKAGSPEPAAWQATATDASAPLGAGTIALYPYLSGSSTNAPVVVTYDDLTVMAVKP